MKLSLLITSLLILFPQLTVAQENYTDLIKMFDYDTTQPLDVQVTQTDINKDLSVQIKDINYISPIAGRVTALLVEPIKLDPNKKYAGIVFLHWGQGDRTEFVWEAAMYANADAVCITLDAPWNRPGEWKQPGEDFSNPEQSKTMYRQNIIDCRRAVDLLIQTGYVDPERIAYIGHSFGATQGGVFAGVEKRVKTFILMGGLPSLVDISTKGARKFDNLVAIIEKYLTAEQWQAYVDVIAPLTPANYIPHAAPSSVFMQFGKYDSWIPDKAAENYFNAASEPKEMKWYLTSHEFTDIKALFDRAKWLEKEIGIEQIVPILQGKLK
ncbi:MAG: hypothetical protein A2V66_05510 [Ignavibacteria bacterium RBG_13_36_8]|nr:MAG: hypothetical protein A2V66_05510 [Ignavibacteria bacterium RBG_13_36_8]